MDRVDERIALIPGGGKKSRRAIAVRDTVDVPVILVDNAGMYHTEPADAMLYLASDESKFMTGSEMVLDGSLTAQ